jgi:hypothetical protein
MNVLRLMGQRGLLWPDAPVRHAAKPRRIKTVVGELIYRVWRLIQTERRIILGLGANDRAASPLSECIANSSPNARSRRFPTQATSTDPQNRARRGSRRGPTRWRR